MSSPFSSAEFNFLFVLTIILLIVKAGLSIYLGKKLLDSRRESGKISLNFITAFFVLMVCFFISRLFYLYFDFVLTRLDNSTYHIMPNVLVWKIAGFILSIGFSFVLYTLDKKALKFKLKGIPAIYTIVMGVIVFLWPVNTPEDFKFDSGLGILSGVSAFLVLIVYLYIGVKIPGLRKPSFMMLAGLITYVAGATLFNEFVVDMLVNMFGPEFRITAYTLFVVLKIAGLMIVAFSVTKFSL